jgi:hypothetical protein
MQQCNHAAVWPCSSVTMQQRRANHSQQRPAVATQLGPLHHTLCHRAAPCTHILRHCMVLAARAVPRTWLNPHHTLHTQFPLLVLLLPLGPSRSSGRKVFLLQSPVVSIVLKLAVYMRPSIMTVVLERVVCGACTAIGGSTTSQTALADLIDDPSELGQACVTHALSFHPRFLA